MKNHTTIIFPKTNNMHYKKTPENIDKVLEAIENGAGVREACKTIDMPHREWYRWLNQDEELVKRYNQAQEVRADLFVEEIIETAKDGSEDWKKKERDGIEYYEANNEHINRSRLIVDTLKWAACHFYPKKYGDKVNIKADVNAKIDDATAGLLSSFLGKINAKK